MSIYLELAIEHVHTRRTVPRVFAERCAWTVTATVAARIRRKNLFYFGCSNKRVVAVVHVHTIWTAWPAVASLRIVFCVQRLSLCASKADISWRALLLLGHPSHFSHFPHTQIRAPNVCVYDIHHFVLSVYHVLLYVINDDDTTSHSHDESFFFSYISLSTDTTVTQ